jgi:hypothetical protein
MEGLQPAPEGPQNSESQLDYQVPQRVLTPLGLQVTRKDRPDLDVPTQEVRISFLIGIPPGVVTEQVTVRLEEGQARELAGLLTGGIVLARANEVPA